MSKQAQAKARRKLLVRTNLWGADKRFQVRLGRKTERFARLADCRDAVAAAGYAGIKVQTH